MANLIPLGGMGAGRPRKPDALKAAQGTLRPNRVNTQAPSANPIAIPSPPPEFDTRRADLWRYFATLVDPMRTVTEADVAAFRLMVEAYAVCQEASEIVQRNGLTYETRGGMIRPRPEAAMIPVYQKIVMYHFNRFGLTPADRARVAALGEDETEIDPLSEFG